MKHTTRRAYALYIPIAAFLAGVVLLVGSIFTNAGDWASHRANRHIYSGGQIASAGGIYDRDGRMLAASQDGKRVFNDNRTMRLATLHTIGDPAGYISTGAHTVYKRELSGYSVFNGVHLLKQYGTGNDLHLTLDASACAEAYRALNGRKGTVGVYNYKTGEILCVVSAPTYDIAGKPANIADDTTGKYEGVYLNRFFSGVYTPGSTMKVVTAASAIENILDIDQRALRCEGRLQTSDGVVICNDVHGTLGFERALAKSCNAAFAKIAIDLGKETLTATAENLGFNTRLKAGDIRLAQSTFDVSSANALDLGWAGIGQYNLLVNPCHMMILMGAIANNGQGTQPYLIDRIVSPIKTVVRRGSTPKSPAITMEPETAARLRTMLRAAVTEEYGDRRFPNLEMCGKTGTAEVGGGQTPHAWFVGFSQREDLPLAVVVVVENGGSGLSQAIPIANKVMQELAGR